MARANPFVAKALEQEKAEGHRLAIIARTIALTIIFVLLPFLDPDVTVIPYMLIVLVFIALGWLQLRMAQVGFSKMELALIWVDLVLLTLVFVVPSPFLDEALPNAYLFRLENFMYFFIFLATATLAYSWRTVWAIGTQVGLLWLIAVVAVFFLGRTNPDLTSAVQNVLPNVPMLKTGLNLDSVQWPVRIKEIVIFAIVAAILAVKGWRSNRLLIQQATIAEERANLSRYFPASLVDTLASTDHDIGAVRNQDIAVLFTDIVGFTSMAEEKSAEEVMALLRDYHAVVERAIFDNEGTLDKYLGDGVMATFGTPIAGDQDAVNAMSAAKQIIEGTQKLNERREAAGTTPFKVSVGVHYGSAILGDIGPERRLEFAVVGDTVNVAARIEAATRDLKCAYAVSDDAMRHAKANGYSGDEGGLKLKKGHRLKGRSAPIDIWLGN